MSGGLLLPMLASVGAAAVAVPLCRRVHPALATFGLTTLLVLPVASLLGGFILLLLATLHPLIAHLLERFFHSSAHHGDPPVLVASIAGAWMVLTGMRIRRRLGDSRALRPKASVPGGLQVIQQPEPVAFTLPGKHGWVVVSTGMLDELSEPEQAVLLAHERSHLCHRHDRFVLVAELAECLLPTGAWLSARVRHETERWADWDAAASVGDRRLTAKAITRAALIQNAHPRPALALAGVGVRARVDELLSDPLPRHARLAMQTAAVMAVALAAATALWQAHHFAVEALVVCLSD